MSYRGLDNVRPTETPHLGGNIKAGEPYTFAPTVWNYVIERFCIESVLDVGSGRGHAASYFFRKGLKVVAIEGLRDNVDKSLFPAITHDLTKGPALTRVDLVHCQEVVEHIEEQYLDNLLTTFACGKVLLMTHGVPGQAGYHHVNLQPPEYWIEHLRSRGFSFLEEDSARVKFFANKEGSKYLANTGLLFVNTQRL